MWAGLGEAGARDLGVIAQVTTNLHVIFANGSGKVGVLALPKINGILGIHGQTIAFAYAVCYSANMNSVVQQIEARRTKLLAKVEKAEKALESARSELADTDAALRVLANIADDSGTSEAKGQQSDAVSERQANILHILPEDADAGLEPKVLHAKYCFNFPIDDVSLDVLRTTVWRMKDRGNLHTQDGRLWSVDSDQGRYWKKEVFKFDL